MTSTPRLHNKYGFIGLGNMGLPMAINLSNWLKENDHPALKVWNRTESKLPPISTSIQHSESIEELVQTCDVIITSLSSDEVVKEIYLNLFKFARIKNENKLKEAGSKGSLIFIDTSTLYPTISGELEREASTISHTFYLQCPVFGPPQVAKEAKLVFVLSGDSWAKRIVQDFLVPSMGKKYLDVGHDVERAASFKLNGNMLILGIVELLAESMTLADKTGVTSTLLFEFIKEFMPAPSFIGYGNKILHNTFSGPHAGFTVTGGLKDASHIKKLAQSVDCPVPIIDLAFNHLITSRALGGAELDWSSLVAGPRLAAGVGGFSGIKAHSQDTGFGSKTDLGTGPPKTNSSSSTSKRSSFNKEEEEAENEGEEGEGEDDPTKMKVGGIKFVKNF